DREGAPDFDVGARARRTGVRDGIHPLPARPERLSLLERASARGGERSDAIAAAQPRSPARLRNFTSKAGAQVLPPSLDKTADSRTPSPSFFHVIRCTTVRPSMRCTSPSSTSAPSLKWPAIVMIEPRLVTHVCCHALRTGS